MTLEKKRIKKTKKQSGGFLPSYNDRKFYNTVRDRTPKKIGLLEKLLSPLATIFRSGNQTEKWKTFVETGLNKVLQEQARLNFIKETKILLLSDHYKNNIPVFYGNQSTKNNEKHNGYNEYICRKILGRFGIISSKRRIFIINPFAEYVYRIANFFIYKNYGKKKESELFYLLKKLLKLDDNFTSFPKITYLPNRTQFCILKDNNGEEKVITHSLEKNYSRCNRVSDCSLMMTAVIREENLPSEEDIIELYYILEGYYDQLFDFYDLSKNKDNQYFEDICILLLQLNDLKNAINNLKSNNIKRIEQNYLKNPINNPKLSTEERIQQNKIIRQIISNQQKAKLDIILNKLKNISLLQTNIPKLQELYQYVKLQLQQPNVDLLQVSIEQLIQKIKTLLESNKAQFLSFLDTKPIQKLTILQILQKLQKLQKLELN